MNMLYRGTAKTANMAQKSCAWPQIALTCQFESVHPVCLHEDMLRYIASLENSQKSY